MPAPKTVIDADPDLAKFPFKGVLAVAESTQKTIVTLPALLPAVTITFMLRKSPRPAWQTTTVSDPQLDPSQTVLPITEAAVNPL